MDPAEWSAFRDRIRHGREGSAAEDVWADGGIHAHAAGFIDFEPELERLLEEVDESILKDTASDTGPPTIPMRGFDPWCSFMQRHLFDRISYMHFQGHRPEGES